MLPLDPVSLFAAYGLVGLLAFGVGIIVLWLLMSVTCFVVLMWPVAWIYKTILRVGSKVFGCPLAIPGESFEFTLMSGFAGWATLCLITLALGAIHGQAEPVMSIKLLGILLAMAVGPAAYAIVRGYQIRIDSTHSGAA